MISPALYKSITGVMLVAKPHVRLTANWQSVHQEQGIGRISPCTKLLLLTPLHRQALLDWVQRELGVDPRTMSYEQAMSRSRTEAAGASNQEKGLSAAVRSNHLEVRSVTGRVGEYHHPDHGYLGLSVTDALALPFTHVMTVENFDTFLCLKAEHLLTLPAASTLLVFRGDNNAHPGAVKKLLNSTTASLYHYGDYDPAGLRIGLSMMPSTQLLLPDLSQIRAEQFIKLTKLTTFAKQEKILRQLERGAVTLPVDLAAHLQFIRDHNIAITQESLMAKQVPLTMVRIDAVSFL